MARAAWMNAHALCSPCCNIPGSNHVWYRKEKMNICMYTTKKYGWNSGLSYISMVRHVPRWQPTRCRSCWLVDERKICSHECTWSSTWARQRISISCISAIPWPLSSYGFFCKESSPKSYYYLLVGAASVGCCSNTFLENSLGIYRYEARAKCKLSHSLFHIAYRQ